MGVTHYDVLGVDPDADGDAIRAAYRRLARETHPDVGGNHDDFVAVAAAWAVLSDRDARARYDSGLGGTDAVDDPDDDGWGEEVGLTASTPRKTAPPTTEPPSGPSSERAVASTSRRHELPSMTEELAWLPPSVPKLSPTALLVSWVMYVAVTVVVAVPLTHTQELRGPGNYDLMFALLYAITLAGVAKRRRDDATASDEDRKWAAVFLWSWVGVFPVLVFASSGEPTGEQLPTPVLPAAVGMVGCLAVALLAERTVRRARRWHPAVAAMHRRRGLAEAWDAFLSAQDDAGDTARVEQGVDGPLRHPVWMLVRVRDGELLAAAPVRAPEAWAATLRLAGVDVGSEPGPPASV